MATLRAAAAVRPKKKMKIQLLRGGFDLPFFVLVVIILLIGLVMMFSASYPDAIDNYKDGLYFIKKQVAFAAIGLAAMAIMANIDYHWLHKFAYPLLAVSFVLLVVVLFMPEIKGCKRWIVLGPLNFQPSEIAKFAVIITFSHYISQWYSKMGKFHVGVVPPILTLGAVAGLMVLEPHLSGTIIILSIGFLLLFVGGTKARWLIATVSLGAGAIGAYAFIFNKVEYAAARIHSWLAPFEDAKGDGWQVIQSFYAIGSGGLMGLGLGNSRQKYGYIPEAQNDFVFSIVCEELGFVGATIVILLFALLVWRGFVISMRAPDRFGSLIALGLTTQVGLQVLLNIAVVTNSIPNTGIGLPFFSSGGSSLTMLLFQMGVVLSVSRFSKARQESDSA